MRPVGRTSSVSPGLTTSLADAEQCLGTGPRVRGLDLEGSLRRDAAPCARAALAPALRAREGVSTHGGSGVTWMRWKRAVRLPAVQLHASVQVEAAAALLLGVEGRRPAHLTACRRRRC